MDEERIAEIEIEIGQINLENVAMSLALQERAGLHAEVKEGPNVAYKGQSVGELQGALGANRRRLSQLRQELARLSGSYRIRTAKVNFPQC